MEKLRSDHFFPTVKRAVRHCALRLASRPELADGAAAMATCRAALRRCEDAYDDALDEKVAATAEVVYRDGRLGRAVAALARDVNVFVDGRTDDARYQRVFLTAPSEGMRPLGGPEQDRFVRNILETLEADDAYADLRKHAVAIGGCQRDLDEAVARRTTLELAEKRAGRELDIATAEARDVYNQMAHRVALVYPKDAALVDSFFWSAAQERAARDGAPDAPVPLSGTVVEGAAVIQQPANESAKAVAADKRARRRRRVA
jgi:hypothetical protein